MSDLPEETKRVHTRLLRCTLEAENSRAYWQHAAHASGPVTAKLAFEEYWFGAKSLGRAELLIANFRARFDAFPPALRVLSDWADMDPDARRLVCHWHLQLSDPLYRAFTGSFLPARHDGGRTTVTHDLVVTWVGEQDSGRWNMATRIQFASKLLSAALAAGLVGSSRDPRPLTYPYVGEEPLTYLLYLLRGVAFEGTLVENPYLASVGLSGPELDDRLRTLSALKFQRQGKLVDFGWRYPDLRTWADFALNEQPRARAGGRR